jgi:hypothetical protein
VDDEEQIAATVTAISDLMQALRYATTEAEIYPGLNLQLTYHPGGNSECQRRNRLDMHERVVSEGGRAHASGIAHRAG